MALWMMLAKGPVFLFALALLGSGLLRLFLLTVWDIVSALRRSGDNRLQLGQIVLQTVKWLLPINRLHRNRAGYSVASFTLHLSLLVVAPFLRNHLDILQANIGISWMALPKQILDVLTVTGIFGIVFLLLYRLLTTGSRMLSRTADYLLLILILNLFLSGFLAGRSWNPIPYNGLMLFHVLNGMLLVLSIPYTKIAHCILFPLIRLGTEVAWHFVPFSGSRAIQTLHGSQGREI